MISLSRQFLDKVDHKFVLKALKSERLTRGNYVKKFEKEICRYTGCKYAVSLNSGSSALMIAYKALDIKKNDIVWTSPITFVSTLSSSLHFGAKYDFVDIGSDFNLSSDHLLKKLKNLKKIFFPKVVTPTHLRGFPTDQDKIYKLKKKYKFKIIEDASHSLGATYKNEKVGSCKWSDITVLSFHPSKSITTGEGGMLLTNNKKYYDKACLFRNNFIKKSLTSNIDYRFDSIGFNFWMTEIQAALGLSQLKKIKKILSLRKKVSDYYDKKLINSDYYVKNICKNKVSSNHLYLICCKSLKHKESLCIFLKRKGIETTTHYPPLYQQPFLKLKKNEFSKKFSNSDKYYKHYLSIPISAVLTKKKQDYIIKNILNFRVKK